MKKILICWVGKTDLRAVSESDEVGLGPIAQAVEERDYDEIVLINNYPENELPPYIEWLKPRVAGEIVQHQRELSSPTNLEEIYEVAVEILSNTLSRHNNNAALTFHLSPGTPHMMTIWVLLAKTRFTAELIDSSLEQGVRTVTIPFDISADFIPDLLRRPDEQLERLSAGLSLEAPEFSDIIHRSRAMNRVIARARRVAPRSVPVLIEGETGTGKELLAKAIHEASTRRDKPFIVVNCGAIPSELIESELLGHEKGAFTGADQRRKGYFEEADGGTIFLDEIGELPLIAQVKLLRVLQEGEVVRVGARNPIEIDVRIIAATNRTLTEEVSSGKFRSDLFYRLAVAVLRLPALRERKGDLSLLIDSLLERVNEESASEPGYKHKKLSASARNLLLQHNWPGNVRELLNTLLRAAVWSPGKTITVEDVREALLPNVSEPREEVLNRPLGGQLSLQNIIDSVARHYLKRALEQTGGNKTQAAKLVGLPNYQTLTNWLKKYDLI
jgi:transcriptional regulator with PAS, ATPase and Fis domain